MQESIHIPGEFLKLWPLSEKDPLFLFGKPLEFNKSSEDIPVVQYPRDLFSVLDTLFEKSDSEQIIHPSATIGEGTVITGPVYIGKDCVIGAHNVLRGPLNLEQGVKTGAFCELKHSIVQEGTHFHSGYVGESIIGKNCRFGGGVIASDRRIDRGTIKVEVEGEKIDTKSTYMGVVIGNETKVGIHVGFMPGVMIGSDCIVGPGTQVFKNLEDHSVIYAKLEVVVKKK
tara:strand:- start:635 stop:1318 length:684 start_codon:yes stop_codon:yes gene_type:complete